MPYRNRVDKALWQRGYRDAKTGREKRLENPAYSRGFRRGLSERLETNENPEAGIGHSRDGSGGWKWILGGLAAIGLFALPLIGGGQQCNETGSKSER